MMGNQSKEEGFHSEPTKLLETLESTEPKKKITLCLSGGGFRATLFHLGVVRALSEKGLLEDVVHISSVSGGSILGAHLILNWEDYCDCKNPDNFDKSVKTLLHFIKSDVRGKITRRYLVTFLLREFISFLSRLLFISSKPAIEKCLDRLTPTGWLIYYYRKNLYGSKSLRALRKKKNGLLAVPTIDILGTNLTKAVICSFSGEGFKSSPNLQTGTKLGHPSAIQISAAVAASSAFPGFFPPLNLRRSILNWDKKKDFAGDHQYISDAGIYDNLGSRGYDELRKQTKDTNSQMIVSAAGAKVDWEVTESMHKILPSVLRTMNIIMELKEDAELTRLTNQNKGIIVSLESDTADNHRIDNDIELKNIRTDLDCFSNTEIACLVQDGYAKTIKELYKNKLSDSETKLLDRNWPLQLLKSGLKTRLTVEDENKELQQSTVIHSGLGFNRFFQDPSGVFLFLVPFLILGFIGFIGYSVYQKEEEFSRKIYINHAISTPIQEVKAFKYVTTPNQGDSWLPPLIEDNKVFDLKAWSTKNPSKITMRRALKFSHSGKDKHQAVAFRVETSGKDVYLEGEYPDPKLWVASKPAQIEKTSKNEIKLRQITFKDLPNLNTTDSRRTGIFSMEQVYELRYRATYHDAFQKKNQWWVGSRVNSPTEKMSILVKFPHDFPPDKGSIQCLVITTGERNERCLADVVLKTIKNQEIEAAYWETNQPKEGSVYKLEWTWGIENIVKRKAKLAMQKPPPNADKTKALISQADKLGEVQSYVDNPIYIPNFKFKKDIRIWDLRSWKKVQKGMKYASAVKMHRTLTLSKERDAKLLSFQVKTTGNGLHIKCPESYLPDKCRIYAETGIKESEKGKKAYHLRRLVLNINEVTMGEDFKVEYETTYFEGFQNKDQRWIVISPESPTPAIILILFPKDRPFDVVQCRDLEAMGTLHGCEAFGQYVEDPNGQYVYLETAPRNKESGIRVEWVFKEMTGDSGQDRREKSASAIDSDDA